MSKFTTYKEFGQEKRWKWNVYESMIYIYICSCLFSHSCGPSDGKYRDVLLSSTIYIH